MAVLPETAAEKLLVQHGRVLGARTGDQGRGAHGQQLPTFEPGNDIVAGVTVLAEGPGPAHGATGEHFRLHGENPQIWALGVKEVWRVPRPLTKIVHTLGWPLRSPAGYGEFGGSFIYPMGDELVTIGFVAGLEARDVQSPSTTSSRSSRRTASCGTSSAAASALPGGRRRSPRAGTTRCPAAERAGLLLVGEGRPRERAAAQGHPLCDRVGPARRGGGLLCSAAGNSRAVSGL